MQISYKNQIRFENFHTLRLTAIQPLLKCMNFLTQYFNLRLHARLVGQCLGDLRYPLYYT